ncbi:MAG TPA: hypothetical protein VGN52_13370 [Burkholderiales bacterium]
MPATFEADRIYLFATREVRDSPLGMYRNLAVIKVDGGTGAYLGTRTREAADFLVKALHWQGKYEVVAGDALAADVYLRPFPVRLFLLETVEMAERFMRTRKTFDYAEHVFAARNLAPLLAERERAEERKAA